MVRLHGQESPVALLASTVKADRIASISCDAWLGESEAEGKLLALARQAVEEVALEMSAKFGEGLDPNAMARVAAEALAGLRARCEAEEIGAMIGDGFAMGKKPSL